MSVLVVVEKGEAGEELLRKASQTAKGANTDLILLSLLSEDEFEADLKTIESIAKVEHTSSGGDKVLDAAKQFSEQQARKAVHEAVEWQSVELLLNDGDRATQIIEVAEEHDCNHVFVLGKRRSPTGKAMFGDATQSILLNFDGYVTVAMQ